MGRRGPSHASRPAPPREADATATAAPPQVEVAAGLIFRNGQLLIAQRRPGDHLGGLWEFPGGKREEAETFEACLQRELMEELALAVEPGELLLSLTHTYPEKTVHLKFYRCSCGGGEPQALGCHAIAWVTPRELASYAFPEADRSLVALLASRPDLWETT